MSAGPSAFSSSHGGPSPRKLTLVLPPLSKAPAAPASAKSGRTPVKTHDSVKKKKGGGKIPVERGPPRPPKPKPLKEVLTRLITQAQKKDAYGFFLNPVDPAQVPGYADVIRRPMDFSTMASKVSKGKYRSLQEFAEDLQLVTGNAKIFNPLGTIYHTEAERIENWASDQITKAAATVIEEEAAWNLDVEKDEGYQDEDDEDEDVLPSVIEAPDPAGNTHSASPAPNSTDDELRALHALVGGRRPPPRAAVQRIEAQRAKESEKEKEKEKQFERRVEDELDENGHMPGYKSGIGVFPPDSGWAEVMVELKFRDKRYRTKKERLRIEKEGLPHAPDGSLDYWEIQDPWSVLHNLVPDPPELPRVEPIFPSPPANVDTKKPVTNLAHILPPIVPPLAAPLQLPPPLGTSSGPPAAPTRKYWSINRSGVSRGGRKDREGTIEPTPSPEDGNTQARPLHATDFGGYATLLPRLANEAKVSAAHVASALSSDDRLHAFLRASLDADLPASSSPTATRGSTPAPAPKGARGYWTDARAREAAEYLRDVVYGGPDGFAYIRSVAEFVSGPASLPPADGDVFRLPLGMTLAEWALRTSVAPLTHGRLSLLASAAKRLAHPTDPASSVPPAVQTQLDTSATLFPHLTLLLLAMRQILTQPIDLAHLLKAPEELLGVHVEQPKAKRKREPTTGEDGGVQAKKIKREASDEGGTDDKQTMDVDKPAKSEDDEEVEAPRMRRVPDFASAAEFSVALKESAEAIVTLEQKRAKLNVKPAGTPVDVDLLEQLRVGLLRLARAVPVDQLAKLPPELVPMEIRHIVPTKMS